LLFDLVIVRVKLLQFIRVIVSVIVILQDHWYINSETAQPAGFSEL